MSKVIIFNNNDNLFYHKKYKKERQNYIKNDILYNFCN